MFDLVELTVPIIAAPMAGGPSTPDLVVSVGEAGGLGFLAGGYKTPEALAEQIREVRARTEQPFGVNLFVPQQPAYDPAAVHEYRDRLGAAAQRYGIELPPIRERDDDWFAAKIDLLIEQQVPVVSLTFGLPPADIAGRLRAAGAMIIATVTTVAEARAALDLEVGALCVQGPEGGGHRGTFRVEDEPETTPLPALLDEITAWCPLPVVAAGGIGDGARIAELLAHGAVAVQLGTAFLRSPESGAKTAYKDALRDPRFTRTVITRAFSGRPARGLANDFIAAHDEAAPAAYPQVHHLTSPVRAAAAARNAPEDMALWAGTGYRATSADPAATILRRLWSEAVAHGAFGAGGGGKPARPNH
ncbi:nitronate monooxygenase [Nocardia speluncae]|uniref:Probable nitronate monooxygenase n=1 Tax=Nocardia speluncae TaxID=419477 RepID=A0A846XHN9_9NOCA|nr:nitronate monooxygenase [Nocardia speluncae]NKY34186.1 nitronate monooxygenase [Nocardia speluncae]